MAVASDRETLVSYVAAREQDLHLLKLDLQCKPFGNGPNKLVIVTDWSEVFAYIFADQPPKDDPLKRVIEGDIVDSAHLAALTFIFERFPGDVILIPPYVDEMTDFVSMMHDTAVADSMGRLATNRLVRKRNASARVEDIAARLTRLHAESAPVAGKSYDIAEQFRNTLQAQDQEDIKEVVEDSFGRLYLLAKLEKVDGLGALSVLLKGAASSPPRLATLAKARPLMAKAMAVRAEIELRWQEELKRELKDDSAKVPRPIYRDAQALSYLEQLNPIMHASGEQMVFVSRSTHIREIMERYPGRFACLSDQYVEVPAQRSDGLNSVYRDWRAFFELAMVWDRLPGDNDGPPVEKLVSDVVDQRLLAAAATRKALEVDTGQMVQALSRELQSDVDHHRQVYISTIRPRLHELSSEVGPTQIATRLFIDYVTDPLWMERSKVKQELLDTMASVMGDLQLMTNGTAIDPWASAIERCRSGTRYFVRQIPTAVLVEDVENPSFRQMFASLFEELRISNSTATDRAIIDVIAKIQIDSSSTSVANVELARLLIIAMFRLGAIEQQGFLQIKHRSLLEMLRVGSAGWIVNQLMTADMRSLRSNALRANSELRRTWLAMISGASRNANDAKSELCLTAFVTTWLRLHLDWVEEEGELINNFPAAPEDNDRFELEIILDYAARQMKQASGGRVDANSWEGVRRAWATSVVYAAGRLAPFVEHLDGIAAQNLQLADGRPMTGLITSYLRAPHVREAFQLLRSSVEKNAEEYSSLAYYLIKDGYWCGAGTTEGRMCLDEAEKCLMSAQNAFEAPFKLLSARLENIVRKHSQLLKEVRSTVNFNRVRTSGARK